jgi:DNA repair protein SbcD/Mre11
MKFAHLGDCHLGSWRIPQLQQLNLESFQRAVDTCIKEKVDFVLIAGDLFDSAYPSIEILKETFFELKKLKDSKIPCFLVAGSHDFSASGKTFLDVIEKAGFCKNVFNSETRGESIILNPEIYDKFAIYGYPGKKSGLEVQELRKIKLQEAPGFFKILMLHTSIKGAVGSLPIDSISESELPVADYYPLGHLHIEYEDGKFVYSGPIFPNNLQELEELKFGSFYIINVDQGKMSYKRIPIKIKEVEVVDLEIKNSLVATDIILTEIKKRVIKDKILILKLSGKLEKGKIGNIDFLEIEKIALELGAFALLKSTSALSIEEAKIEIEVSDMNKIEETIINKYKIEKKSNFSDFIDSLMNSFALEKQEDEKSSIFEERLFAEIKKVVNLT